MHSRLLTSLKISLSVKPGLTLVETGGIAGGLVGFGLVVGATVLLSSMGKSTRPSSGVGDNLYGVGVSFIKSTTYLVGLGPEIVGIIIWVGIGETGTKSTELSDWLFDSLLFEGLKLRVKSLVKLLGLNLRLASRPLIFSA